MWEQLYRDYNYFFKEKYVLLISLYIVKSQEWKVIDFLSILRCFLFADIDYFLHILQMREAFMENI